MGAALVPPDAQQAFEAILASEGPKTEDPRAKVTKVTKPESVPESLATEEAEPEETEGAESAEPEAEVETEAEEIEPESEETPVEMFADLAKALGREETDLLAGLKIPGIDGKPVPLADVVTAYRTSAQTGALKSQLEAKYAEFDGKIQEFEAKRDTEFAQIQGLTKRLIEKVDADQKIDWARLKEEDLQGYLLAKSEAKDREDAVRASIQAQIQERSRLEGVQSEQREKWKLDEGRKIASAHPEWVGTEAGKQAMAEVTGLMDAVGLKPQEVGDFLPDHRVFQVVWEAAQWRKLQAKGPLTLKALKSVPKVAGPQGRPPVRDRKVENVKKLRGELEKRGDIESAANFFMETMT